MAISKGSWSPASGMKENWLVQVYETGSTTNFIGLSFFDQTCDSESYIGGIVNIPSIREKINIFKSTSSLSNVSIDCALGIAYIRSDGNASVANLAYELLFQEGRYYLNGTVKIFSSLSNDSDFDDVPQIYEGRLESMTHNDSVLSLNIVAARPWDNLKFPNVYSQEKILAPMAYGDFTGNDSTYPGTGTDNWRPIPFTKADAASAYFVAGTNASTSFSKTSQYVPIRDGFVPFDSASTTTTTTGSVENVTVGVNGKYKYYTTPSSSAQQSTQTGITETNMSNSFDLNTATYGSITYSETISTGEDRYHVQRYTVPETEEGTQFELTYRIASYSKAADVELLEITPYLETELNSATGTAHSANATSQTLTLVTTAPTTYVDLKVRFQTEEAEDTSGGAASVVFGADELSISNVKNDEKLEKVYVDIDGENKNYLGLTTTLVANIHEAHRQFFHTHLGIDTNVAGPELVANGDGSSTSGWSNLRCDLSIVSDRLRVESNATSGNGYCYRNITCEVGEVYLATADFVAGNTSGCKFSVGQTDALATGTFQGTSSTLTTNTSVSFEFTATQTTMVVWLYQVGNNADGTYDDWDNISVKERDPAGWSDLDTDRSGWTIRGWIDKPTTAKQILNKLAVEGCFCYTWSASAGLKYIHVKNSYGSSNHSIDKNDVKNVNINHTPISELITDITVNYDRHPGKDEYRSQATADESSIRGNYNIAANESKHTFDLDFLSASIGSDLTPGGGTENDSFIGYLGQLMGKPRAIVIADVINPAYFGIELGDIVDFSGDMIPTKPFGKSFGSAYRYMVTGLTRTSGKLSAEFTEVF